MSNRHSSPSRSVGGFMRDRRGNVALIFGLAMLPVVGCVGAAVDYSRANAAQAALQSALDSTSLMLSKEAAVDTPAQLRANAAKYFAALFTEKNVGDIRIDAKYASSGGSTVTVTGSASVPTSFLSVIGYDNIGVSGSSTAKWGSTRLRVALVLDNTGSMADAGKMAALKSATKNMLTQLQAAATANGDVYVSIVPFVKDVNVGSANYNSSWIDWTDWDAKNGTCSSGGSSFSSFFMTKNTCSGTWTPARHSSWNGCVMDRGNASGPSTGNYDTNVAAPAPTLPASLYAAEQYPACPQAGIGLSYDWTAMNNLVDNMYPAGNTNQAIGLQLGWMSLVGGGPFTSPPMTPNYKYQQIIILLTDGLNTQDRWYINQSSIDARQQMTCDNIKASGMTLYTIQVNTDGDPTSTLLQNCASSADKFFLLTSANQIVAAFNKITTDLTQLRIAQ